MTDTKPKFRQVAGIYQQLYESGEDVKYMTEGALRREVRKLRAERADHDTALARAVREQCVKKLAEIGSRFEAVGLPEDWYATLHGESPKRIVMLLIPTIVSKLIDVIRALPDAHGAGR